ncbi:RAMP superfamily CRISPR-associated protein [uncultured Thiodictyon sp.]|uniref:RAMP superfamily CRISPR-associated protein n=1 Tax=uncultured Thiodictyon sp. TaxID=1846217 RepID=UPI0025F987C8|nr:RAMP superfamily CRISPR-associated protein [uncultured Thiodictyon sp.]
MTELAASPLFIRLEVEALEDLHTGTGTGSGDIDALVQRDRHGRPVIRVSHFKGLLREAGMDLVSFGKATKEELNHLLGTPGSTRGALRMTSLRVSAGGATLVWGSTKRVDGGRAPEEDTLRFVEHVAAGTRFLAQLRLADASLQPLLERLLNRVDRIGGERNRGSGLVKLDWQPITINPGQSLTNATGTRLRLVLRNLEPLCLPATGHPGNLIRSHSFIRGQTLRGALIAWAIHNGRPDSLALFERVSVGDALPLPEGTSVVDTVLPIPLSILTEKPRADGPDIPWWAGRSPAAPEFDRLDKEPMTDEKPKRPGAHEYLCRSGDTGPWLRYNPTMSVRLRNATPERDSGKDANLFSMEEIAEDTRFQAELRFDDEATARDFLGAFAPLLCGGDWLGIGRAGQPAIVESVGVVQGQDPGTTTFTDDWTLTLVSDLIVRGESLGFLDDLDIDRLCALAGVEQQAAWVIDKKAVESEAIHGFNAVSGLQRAPALALRRGSCWRIKGPGSAMLARLLADKSALGERVREGCGRFLIDAQPVAEIGRRKPPKADPPTNRREELLAIARQLSGKIKTGGPSLSQLQWLRERALAAETDGQLDALLNEITTAPQRRPQGGKAWSAFQPLKLKEELGRLSNPGEKRQLISYLVQWRVPFEKENRG